MILILVRGRVRLRLELGLGLGLRLSLGFTTGAIFAGANVHLRYIVIHSFSFQQTISFDPIFLGFFFSPNELDMFGSMAAKYYTCI